MSIPNLVPGVVVFTRSVKARFLIDGGHLDAGYSVPRSSKESFVLLYLGITVLNQDTPSPEHMLENLGFMPIVGDIEPGASVDVSDHQMGEATTIPGTFIGYVEGWCAVKFSDGSSATVRPSWVTKAPPRP